MTTGLLCSPSDMLLYGKCTALRSINITLISHFFVGVQSIMKNYLKALYISKVVLQTVCQYQFSLKLIVFLTPDIPINPHVVVHFPSLIPAGNPGTNYGPHRRSRVCYCRGKRTAKEHPFKTVYVCKFCPWQPRPHPDEFFQVYHSCLDYANVWETILNYFDILHQLVFFEVVF